MLSRVFQSDLEEIIKEKDSDKKKWKRRKKEKTGARWRLIVCCVSVENKNFFYLNRKISSVTRCIFLQKSKNQSKVFSKAIKLKMMIFLTEKNHFYSKFPLVKRPLATKLYIHMQDRFRIKLVRFLKEKECVLKTS